MRFIIRNRQRIDHPTPGKGQAGLARQIGDLFHRTQRLGVALKIIKQKRHISGLHRAKPDAARLGLNLDQRFQPDHAAGAVADQLHRDVACFGFGHDRCGNLIGANRHGGGVQGHVNLHALASASRVSSFSAVSRPCSLSSTIAAGPEAQRPRQ